MKHLSVFASLMIAFSAAVPSAGEESGWIELMPEGKELDAWKGGKRWTVAGDAEIDPKNSKALVPKDGRGVVLSSPRGRALFRNLTSKQAFADLEVHAEFLIPAGSNAGVKLQGLYEIQILDSHGKEKPTASDCGGVYPRAELLPRYHTIDEGSPPKVNASKKPGQWQTLDIVFRAPRFDADGKKTTNARFARVLLNGQLVQEDVELKWPTGHAWRKGKEVPAGPLFLQGDHGPVAYRNVRVRPIGQGE